MHLSHNGIADSGASALVDAVAEASKRVGAAPRRRAPMWLRLECNRCDARLLFSRLARRRISYCDARGGRDVCGPGKCALAGGGRPAPVLHLPFVTSQAVEFSRLVDNMIAVSARARAAAAAAAVDSVIAGVGALSIGGEAPAGAAAAPAPVAPSGGDVDAVPLYLVLDTNVVVALLTNGAGGGGATFAGLARLFGRDAGEATRGTVQLVLLDTVARELDGLKHDARMRCAPRGKRRRDVLWRVCVCVCVCVCWGGISCADAP